jgi:hypothetical protein
VYARPSADRNVVIQKKGGTLKNEESSEGEATTDPFDPARLRLSQDFESQVGVKKALITVPVRRPDRQWFVRVHPDDSWRLQTAVLEIKEDRESYLVDRALWCELPGEIVPKVLFTTISRQSVTFLWPVRLPGSDGRHDAWSRSLLEAARMAESSWIRVVANMSLGAYEVYQATGDFPEPSWPDTSFQNLLKIAFKDRYVTSMDHPVVQRLRGAI